MTPPSPLGLTGLFGIHYYVADLERSRHFYVDQMDFSEVARSNRELEHTSQQRSAVFAAGDCRVMVSTPLGEGGRAWRFLRHHPDGIGTIAFEVEDIERTFRLLDERGGTPISDIQRYTDDGGELATFSITTPFGDTTFRFIQRRGYADFMPGVPYLREPQGGGNSLEFTHIDHITSNFQTMKPALLWMEHVMGFERFWSVEFHTSDIAKQEQHRGSGLRSEVMWDPSSGVRFANNEPYRPSFKASQINVFNLDHRGDGVQHVALATRDIIATVRELRARGVRFMPTPDTYYEMLPERLQRSGIGQIDEDIQVLEELEILVDGDEHHRYLLQIFLQDSAAYHGSPQAGPFFYEIIQRKGDDGFGAGNFRALFESIEREQVREGRA